MDIALSRYDTSMADQLLQREDIGTCPNEPRRVVVTKHVWVNGHPCLSSSGIDNAVYCVIGYRTTVLVGNHPLRLVIGGVDCVEHVVVHRDDAFLVTLATEDKVVPVPRLEAECISPEVDNLARPESHQQQFHNQTVAWCGQGCPETFHIGV